MTDDELTALFAPHIIERRAQFLAGARLVHYTSAEAAYRIVEGRSIWLRNASMMNDFSEIQHGIHCLSQAWSSDAGKRLQAMLNRLKDGLCDELVGLFDGHADALRLNTFITSLSEHDESEDELGRLSMWRAYGGRAGVALVLNTQAFAATTDAMQVFSSPVFYRDAAGFVSWFERWSRSLIEAEEALLLLDPAIVQQLFFMAFRDFALCTKHPGFAEEREWRVYHSPSLEKPSAWIAPSVEIIGGIPQHLMKLSLHDDEPNGIFGVAPISLVNRVIIGPCEHPLQIRASIAEALLKAGISAPLERMWMSFIPLRQP